MKRKYKVNISLLLISFALSLLLVEIVLHSKSSFSYEKNGNLGWSAQPNVTLLREIQQSANQTAMVNSTYYEHGFRRWGNLNSDKKKIFLVGDSFTEMPYVNNGKEYYSYLENDFEMFVFGKAAYGTLQEFMIIDMHIDEINPDIIVVQFDPSDILDNSYELDRMRYPYNSFIERPYLENSKIVYRSPVPFENLRKVSRTADIVSGYFDKLNQQNINEVSAFYTGLWKKLSKREDLLEPTILIMNRVYERSDIPIFLFSTTEERYYHELCENTMIKCIKSVSKALELAKSEGNAITIYNDPHWNELGNEIVGNELLEYLRNEIK